MSIVDPQHIYHRVHGPEAATPPALPVVLLHGLMGFSANWGKVWPDFHSQRKVLVLDQRGHGRSAKPKEGYSPSDYARDLEALLSMLQWKKVHLVGHSMGGRVALRFASLFPERTASLTMEDSGTNSRPERVQWIIELLGSIPTPFPNRDAAKAFFAGQFTGDAMTSGFLHSNLEEKPSGVWDWRFFAPGMIETIEKGRATDAGEEFAGLQIPILLIRGSRSKEFPAEEAQAMAGANPNASLVTIQDAGHFVHAEKPRDFNQALSTFLDRIEKKIPN